ncbi:MAG: DNA polymerase IV, partial [Lachnospiraceae bacterium]|nr:DNA polymerase IV [Lachnospiraceae bacterium]
PIRHLGVHTSRVTKNGNIRQLTLFDHTDYEKLEKLDQAIDSIRKRFGADAIQRASFLKQDKIDHMNGGISREKRSVDYRNEKVR